MSRPPLEPIPTEMPERAGVSDHLEQVATQQRLTARHGKIDHPPVANWLISSLASRGQLVG